MMENKEQMVECPICSKEFSSSAIETHASRCLFLNESSNAKRPSSTKASSPIVKKPKYESKIGSPSCSSSGSNASTLQKTNFLNQDDSDAKLTSTSNFTNVKKSNEKIEKKAVPLAEKMRPNSIISYVGQKHVLGPKTMMYQLLSKAEIPNVILWGPPGCGKTSLANVIGNVCKHNSGGKYRFVKLSAAMSGVNDVKEAITIASNELKFGRRTVIFMDEIHRFNKAQQDIFLPHIESGTITLIGATTENPSFNLNSALLSRCRVVVLEKLNIDNVVTILEGAVKTCQGSVCNSLPKKGSVNATETVKFFIDKETIKWLAETSDGDARIALGGLELAIQSKISSDCQTSSQTMKLISLDDIKESLKRTHMLYDKKGEQHYDIISALHKSMRASDENASLYWLTRMMAGGEDPVYIARRLVRFASEDVGLEDPKALGIAVHTMHACKMMGMPDCDVLLAQCATYLAKAPKSRLMEDSVRAAQRLVAEYKGAQPSVPLHLRNAPTKMMKDLGYGKGYNMKHKDQSNLNYLPAEIENVNFFND